MPLDTDRPALDDMIATADDFPSAVATPREDEEAEFFGRVRQSRLRTAPAVRRLPRRTRSRTRHGSAEERCDACVLGDLEHSQVLAKESIGDRPWLLVKFEGVS